MRSNRMISVVLGLVGFGAATALVGAGSVLPDHQGGSSTADDIVTATALLVGLGALGFTIYVVRRTSRPASPRDETTGTLPAFLLRPALVPVLSTILVLLAYALVVGPCLGQEDSGSPVAPGREVTTTAAPVGTDTNHRSRGRPDWSVVTGIVLGAAGLGFALVAARNRRSRPPEPDEPGLSEEIALSLADLDALDGDPDHRRVVIRTYARMERALGRTGVDRQSSETSQEFLQHALGALGAGAEAASRLTDLFEQARFSTHPIDETMRADAAASLRMIRDDIAHERLRRTDLIDRR